MTPIIIVLYVLGYVASYFCNRYTILRKEGYYTLADRTFNLIMSVWSWVIVTAFLISKADDAISAYYKKRNGSKIVKW